MFAGKLRNKLVVQVKDTTKNTYGEETTVWEDDTEVWASIMPIRGQEYFHAQSVQSVVTHRIRTRYFKLSNGDRVTPENRIKWTDMEGATRYFNIQGIVNIEERNRQLDFMCVEEIS